MTTADITEAFKHHQRAYDREMCRAGEIRENRMDWVVETTLECGPLYGDDIPAYFVADAIGMSLVGWRVGDLILTPLMFALAQAPSAGVEWVKDHIRDLEESAARDFDASHRAYADEARMEASA